MIVLRPTRLAAKYLGIVPLPGDPTGPSRLGDWYLNVVQTSVGGMYVFVSSATLLAVAVPTTEQHVPGVFMLRVANLLAMIEVPQHVIEAEVHLFAEIFCAKPISRRVQGSAAEIAYQLQCYVEDAPPGNPISLSDMELHLASIPHGPLSYAAPRAVAVSLMTGTGSVA